MLEMNIKKVKLLKGDKLEVVFEKQMTDGTTTEVTEKHKTPVHPDLRSAFYGLNLHLALIGEMIKARSIKDFDNPDPEIYKDYHVTSFSIGGGEEGAGVVLSGYKTLSNQLVLGINTPFRRFEEAPETKYQQMDHLVKRLDKVKSEVELYLSGEKVGVLQQLDMFKEPDENGDEDPNQNKLDFEGKGETGDDEIPEGFTAEKFGTGNILLPDAKEEKPKKERKKRTPKSNGQLPGEPAAAIAEEEGNKIQNNPE